MSIPTIAGSGGPGPGAVRRAAAALACASLLAGCGAVTDYLGGEDNTTPPVELTDIETTLEVKTLWSRRVTSGVEKQYLKLRPTIDSGRVYAAGRAGDISAFDALTGDAIWDIDTDAPISGGPGAAGDTVVVGTTDGEVIAVSSGDGALKWRARVSSEVLAAPAVGERIVVVRTIDGRLFGLNTSDGSREWVYDRTVPVLTLRGTSSPVIAGDTVVAGFDSGRLVALSAATGQPLWETQIAIPRGRTELERMVDLDADPVVRDDTVFAVTFQGRVAAMDLTTGEVLWRRDMSSHAGIGVGRRLLYVTDDTSHVWALERRSSSSMWRQSKLGHRGVTSPVEFRDYVVIADFEGYAHWLSRDDGRFVARILVDSDGVLAPPVVTEDAVYLYGKSGELTALTVE